MSGSATFIPSPSNFFKREEPTTRVQVTYLPSPSVSHTFLKADTHQSWEINENGVLVGY